MDDETGNATTDISNAGEGSGSPTPDAPQQEQTLETILAQTGTDLVHALAASINQGAMKETGRTEEVRQEVKRRLFRATARTYVWSTSRLAREMETAEKRLVEDMRALLSAEREEGRSRSRPRTILDRLRTRLSELMRAVNRAVEVFAQF